MIKSNCHGVDTIALNTIISIQKKKKLSTHGHRFSRDMFETLNRVMLQTHQFHNIFITFELVSFYRFS